MKRPGPRALVIAFVVLGAGALAARSAAVEHVRKVTGTEPTTLPSCLDCHSGGSLSYERGVIHAAPVALAADPRGRLVFAACGALRRVAVVDADAAVVLRWIEVPGEASGVAVSPDGRTLAVSLDDVATVALVDVASGEVLSKIGVGLEPKGIAFGADGATLIVANAGSGDVSVVDVARRRERSRVPSGRDPYRVAVSPDGRRAAIACRMASVGSADSQPHSEVTILDAKSGAVERRVMLPSCHLTEGLTFASDGGSVLVPTIRVRNLLPITQVARGWVMSSDLAIVDAASGVVSLLPLQTVNRAFPDPAGVAVSPDGAFAFVASGGSDVVGVIDLRKAAEQAPHCAPDATESFALARHYIRARVDVGSAPGDVVRVGAGARIAVADRLGDSITLLDAVTMRAVGRVPLGPRIDDDGPRRGARVFQDAEFAFQHQFSCRSCHPDGHTDGLTYDFEVDGVGRDVVLNRSLQGVKGTAPFKWNGLNPTLERQCGPRFAMVLTRADPIPDSRLTDVVAYLESMPPPRAPGGGDPVVAVHGDGPATTARERGKAIYFRTKTKKGVPIAAEAQCVTCHPPPHYANLQRADVGTQGARDTSSSFDVPHLTGIGRKAPYLHDGRARSLEEIWTLPGVEDRHGVVTDLNKADLNDLIEYLRSL